MIGKNIKKIIPLIIFLTLICSSSQYAMRNTLDNLDPFDPDEYIKIQLHDPIDQEQINIKTYACPSLVNMCYKILSENENVKITAQAFGLGSFTFGVLETFFAIFGETKNKLNMAADPTFLLLNGLIGLSIIVIYIGVMKEWCCGRV